MILSVCDCPLLKECLLGIPLVMTDQWGAISGLFVLSENIFLSIQLQANF